MKSRERGKNKMTDENSDQNEFLEQAKRLVKKLESEFHNGEITRTKQLGEKDIAAIVWEAEGIGDYHYDQAYLVYKNKKGLNTRIIADTKGTKEHIHIDAFIENGEYLFVKVRYTDPDYKGRFNYNKNSSFAFKKKDLGNGNGK